MKTLTWNQALSVSLIITIAYAVFVTVKFKQQCDMLNAVETQWQLSVKTDKQHIQNEK